MSAGRFAAAALATALVSCVHAPTAKLSPRDQALALLKADQPASAAPLLAKLHRTDPQDLDVARWLVEAHVKAGTADELMPTLDAAWPAHDEVRHYMLGLLYYGRSATEAPKAARELELAIELAPKRAELRYRLGLLHLETEAYEAALARLQEAHAIEPDRRPVLLPLARALARTGDRAAAVVALRDLVRSSPTPAEVKTARALMAELSGEMGKVPKAAQPKLDDGIKWLQQYDAPQPAIVAFEEVLRDFPDLSSVHALLGLSYLRLDDAGRAIDAFKRAIELQPSVGQYYFYLGEVYRAHGRPDQAQEQYSRAVERDPLLGEAYLGLGDLAFERRDLAKATEAYSALTSLEPESVPARGKLAAALQLDGNWAGADRQLRAALDLAPRSLELELRLGLLHAERSRKSLRGDERKVAAQEAALWLRKVLDEQPENALASRALESLRSKE